MKFVIRPDVKLSLLCFMVLFLTACGDGDGQKLISEANNEWIKGRNQSAVEIFKKVLKKYPSTPFAQEALFRLGEIYHFSLDNSEQAIVYFQEVMATDKAGFHSFHAQKYIAEIVEFTFKDLDQAIIEYQNLINKFDQSQEKGDHQYRIASIYFKKRNYKQALVEFEVLLEKYPKSPRVEETQFKILEALYTLKRCSDVHGYYDDFIERSPGSQYHGEMKFVVASCLEEEGMLQDAFDMFASLEDNYTYPALLQIKLEGIEKRIRKKK